MIFDIPKSNRFKKSPKMGLIPTPSQNIIFVLLERLAR